MAESASIREAGAGVAIPLEPFPDGVLCIDDAGRHLPRVDSAGPYAVHENAAKRLWGANGRGLPSEWLEEAIGKQQAALEAAPYEDEELVEEMKMEHFAALNEVRALLDVLNALDLSVGGRAPQSLPLPGLELAPVEAHADRSMSPRRGAQYDSSRAQLLRARELVHLDAKVDALTAAATRLHLVAGALDERARAENARTQLSSRMRHRWSPSDLRHFDDACIVVSCGVHADAKCALPGRAGLDGRELGAATGQPAAADSSSAEPRAAPPAGIEAQVNEALLRTWSARFHRMAFAQMRDDLLGRTGGNNSTEQQRGRQQMALHWGPTHVALALSPAASGSAASALFVGIYPTLALPAAEPRSDETEHAADAAEAPAGDSHLAPHPAKRARADADAREPAAAAPTMGERAPAETAAAVRAGTLTALLGALAMRPAGRLPSDFVRADDEPSKSHLIFGEAVFSTAHLLPGHAASGALLVGSMCRAAAQLCAAPLLLGVLHALPSAYSSAAVTVSVTTRALGCVAHPHAADAASGHAGAARGAAVGSGAPLSADGAAATGGERALADWPAVLGGGFGFEVRVAGCVALEGELADGRATLRSAGYDAWRQVRGELPPGCAFSGPLATFARCWDELGAGDAEELAPLLLLLSGAVAEIVCAARLARAMQLARGLGLAVGMREEEGAGAVGEGARDGGEKDAENGACFVARAGSGAHVLVRQPRPSHTATPSPLDSVGAAPAPSSWLPRLEPLAVETSFALAETRLAAGAHGRAREQDGDGLGCVCAALLKCRACGAKA